MAMARGMICVGLLVALPWAAARGAAAASWTVVEQPDLEQALATAPTLQTESLGEPAMGVLTFTDALVPNPDGKSWDYLQWYFKEYYRAHLAVRHRPGHR